MGSVSALILYCQDLHKTTAIFNDDGGVSGYIDTEIILTFWGPWLSGHISYTSQWMNIGRPVNESVFDDTQPRFEEFVFTLKLLVWVGGSLTVTVA